MTDYFNDELINQIKDKSLNPEKKNEENKKQKFYSKNRIKIDALEKILH